MSAAHKAADTGAGGEGRARHARAAVRVQGAGVQRHGRTREFGHFAGGLGHGEAGAQAVRAGVGALVPRHGRAHPRTK
ncbi:hypothetical protein [Streptomyces cavernicola]|uniref:Uncharacterized protein n=1 Tax=Streptomyces cavernicola TaxID=3043613 RepID=A0ABT6SDB5_9ACTN|nr:hypothetical protein [Streptomyces sp. B-S-A6]MDI3406165.1 hypothetical protein [Streptomyces sp. B-S-A6]